MEYGVSESSPYETLCVNLAGGVMDMDIRVYHAPSHGGEMTLINFDQLLEVTIEYIRHS
jgi:hypothetical protein